MKCSYLLMQVSQPIDLVPLVRDLQWVGGCCVADLCAFRRHCREVHFQGGLTTPWRGHNRGPSQQSVLGVGGGTELGPCPASEFSLEWML